MKAKLLNLCAIATSLVGYLEWGRDSHSFLAQAEIEVLAKLFTAPSSIIHPFIIIPLAGQVMLLASLFTAPPAPSKLLSLAGVGCIAMLLGFMFVIGVLSMNYKIALSTVPFLIVSVLVVMHWRKQPWKKQS